MLDFLASIDFNIIVLDRLELDETFVKQIKENVKSKIIIFGNTSAANKYADVVVNAVVGSNFKNRKFVDETTNTLYLYGPKYLVLRKEFYDIRKRRKIFHKHIKKIVLIFGGSDSSNLTSKVLDKLLSYGEDWEINVLLGAAFNHFDALNGVIMQYQGGKEKVSIYKDARSVAKFMCAADLVMTSPGLSMFETFCVNVPAILICQNSYQKTQFSDFVNVYDESILDKLKEVISDTDILKKNLRIAKNLMVGEGKKEIIDLILEER
jgi:spore coat polysaccharide biosynthesis predicted glycosyltransferase SpsG